MEQLTSGICLQVLTGEAVKVLTASCTETWKCLDDCYLWGGLLDRYIRIQCLYCQRYVIAICDHVVSEINEKQDQEDEYYHPEGRNVDFNFT